MWAGARASRRVGAAEVPLCTLPPEAACFAGVVLSSSFLAIAQQNRKRRKKKNVKFATTASKSHLEGALRECVLRPTPIVESVSGARGHYLPRDADAA